MRSCNHPLAEPSGLPDKWPVSGRGTFCGAPCSSLALCKTSSRLHLQGKRMAAAYELGFSRSNIFAESSTQNILKGGAVVTSAALVESRRRRRR